MAALILFDDEFTGKVLDVGTKVRAKTRCIDRMSWGDELRTRVGGGAHVTSRVTLTATRFPPRRRSGTAFVPDGLRYVGHNIVPDPRGMLRGRAMLQCTNACGRGELDRTNIVLAPGQHPRHT